MTKEKEAAKKKLKKLTLLDDEEVAHRKADIILCNFLIHLGHKDVVAIFNSINKWYS